MKIERTGPARATRATGAAAYARQAEAVASTSSPATIGATANVLGIPEHEFTPRVRDAIVTLMGEVDNLRRDLQSMRVRLEEAEKYADQDQLLPLLNRRAFVRELTRYISFASRYGTPASLIYFDLNGFKVVNDTYGHAGGDAVLANFAKVFNDNVRDSDCVGRLGGDEFGVLLSHADQTQAHKKADILAQKLRASPTLFNGQTIEVSFAYGAFELKSGDDAAVAMARADEAMYAHKRGSR
ncbi:MAG: GGDEF domain-containing protein [Alphaproteobacteria bacterium]|nr:GGDEF domain-containing protein [Alphaproteobacteria bacterium]MBV9540839.1 GGDEF domain-containing protein [Alphaproteobacteria bacterium]MBV9905404.1 GGDEF domain-containing protein [Alphaproteobacteria bacterium]